MTTYPETPDAWIERRPEDNGTNMEDICPVCGQHADACECEGEDLQ